MHALRRFLRSAHVTSPDASSLFATRMLAEKSRPDVSFDPFFTHILCHELMHGLGPHSITVNGRVAKLGEQIQGRERVCLDGKPVRLTATTGSEAIRRTTARPRVMAMTICRGMERWEKTGAVNRRPPIRIDKRTKS